MATRSIASGSISFGLVTIPVKLYTATQAQGVHFNMLDPETKRRVSQQYIVPSTGEVIQRGTCVKGYEYSKDQFVVFTDEEMKALEEPSNGGIFEIVEFVPASTVDLLGVEKSYYVGPNKGGDKSYTLLTTALIKQEKYAVAQWISRGKTHLIILRPYKNGLVAHQMFYADEVRDFDAAIDLAKVRITDGEVSMACQLINTLSTPAFERDKFEDKQRKVVLAAIEAKVNGGGTYEAPKVDAAQALDLFEALKASLEAQQAKTGEVPAPAPTPVEEATAAVAQAVASVEAAVESTASIATESLEKPYKGRGYGKDALIRLRQDLAKDADAAALAYGKPADLLSKIVQWEIQAGKLKGVQL